MDRPSELVIDTIAVVATAAITSLDGHYKPYFDLTEQQRTNMKERILDRIEYICTADDRPYDLDGLTPLEITKHHLFCAIVDTFI